METINNLTTSASKMIFGESDNKDAATAQQQEQAGTEPVSGEQGRGTVDEPYDAGNQHDDPSMSGQAAQETQSTGTGGSKLAEASQDHGPHATYTANVLDPRTGPSATETTFGNVDGPNYGSASTGGGSTGERTTLGGSSGNFGSNDGSTTTGTGSDMKPTGITTTEEIPSASTTTDPTATEHIPSTTGPTSTLGRDDGIPNTLGGSTGAAQGINTAGAIRPEHDTPGTGVTSLHSNDPKGSDVRPSEANEARPNVNAGGFGTAEPSVSADPTSAPQPTQKQQGGDRPTEEPTGDTLDAVREKKNEGEAALAKRDPDDHSGEPLKMHDGSGEGKTARSASSGGQEGGGEHGKEQGTGEQYVKSSGLAADGGDFDAANPGAGREADRLMDQKGVERTGADDSKTGSSPAPHGDSGVGDSSGGKKSLSEKVKEKLHIGKH